MNFSFKALIFFFFLSTVASQQAWADMVTLKNGYEMEGIIKRETEEYVELEIDLGTVKFYQGQIKEIDHYSKEENQALEDSWESERSKKEVQQKTRQQETETGYKDISVGRKGDHLYANVVLNGRVNVKLLIDTGASFVVISPAIAKQLDISLDGNSPDLKLTLADGREVPGKMIKLDSIGLGEVKAENVETAVIFQENAFSGFDGLLGMSFLKLFKFEINLEKSKLILKKI